MKQEKIKEGLNAHRTRNPPPPTADFLFKNSGGNICKKVTAFLLLLYE